MTGPGDRFYDIVDMINRVGDSSIFSLGTVVIVNLAALIYCLIFQQCIAANRMLYIRLALLT